MCKYCVNSKFVCVNSNFVSYPKTRAPKKKKKKKKKGKTLDADALAFSTESKQLLKNLAVKTIYRKSSIV